MALRRRLLVALGVSVMSAVVIGSQPAAVLPEPLRTHLAEDRFQVVTSIRGLPLGVRDALQSLFRTGSLDIAEPGAEFQATDVMIKANLPIRRLVAAGCASDHHCLVYYERGGIAHTWQAALFQWSPASTRFEWGGAAPGSLATIEDVRKAMVSGAIKGPIKIW